MSTAASSSNSKKRPRIAQQDGDNAVGSTTTRNTCASNAPAPATVTVFTSREQTVAVHRAIAAAETWTVARARPTPPPQRPLSPCSPPTDDYAITYAQAERDKRLAYDVDADRLTTSSALEIAKRYADSAAAHHAAALARTAAANKTLNVTQTRCEQLKKLLKDVKKTAKEASDAEQSAREEKDTAQAYLRRVIEKSKVVDVDPNDHVSIETGASAVFRLKR